MVNLEFHNRLFKREPTGSAGGAEVLNHEKMFELISNDISLIEESIKDRLTSGKKVSLDEEYKKVNGISITYDKKITNLIVNLNRLSYSNANSTELEGEIVFEARRTELLTRLDKVKEQLIFSDPDLASILNDNNNLEKARVFVVKNHIDLVNKIDLLLGTTSKKLNELVKNKLLEIKATLEKKLSVESSRKLQTLESLYDGLNVATTFLSSDWDNLIAQIERSITIFGKYGESEFKLLLKKVKVSKNEKEADAKKIADEEAERIANSSKSLEEKLFEKYGKYKDFINASSSGMLRALFYGDSQLVADNAADWFPIVTEKIEIFSQRDELFDLHLRQALEQIKDLYDFGIFNSKIVNTAYMAVDVKNISSALEIKGQNAVSCWDKFRQTELYREAITPLIFRMEIETVDSQSKNWAGNSDWQGEDQKVNPLLEHCHKDLIEIGNTNDLQKDDPDYEDYIYRQDIPDLIRNAIVYKRFIENFSEHTFSTNEFETETLEVKKLIFEIAKFSGPFRTFRENAAYFFMASKRSARAVNGIGDDTDGAGSWCNDIYQQKKLDLGPASTEIALVFNVNSNPFFGFAMGGYYTRNGRILLINEVIQPDDKLVIPYKKGKNYVYETIDLPTTDKDFEKIKKKYLPLVDKEIKKSFEAISWYKKDLAYECLKFEFGEKIVRYLEKNRLSINSMTMFPSISAFFDASLVIPAFSSTNTSEFPLLRNSKNTYDAYKQALKSTLTLRDMAFSAFSNNLPKSFDDTINDFGTELSKINAFDWDLQYIYSSLAEYEKLIFELEKSIHDAQTAGTEVREINLLKNKLKQIKHVKFMAKKNEQQAKLRHEDMVNYLHKLTEIFIISLFYRISSNFQADYEAWDFAKPFDDKFSEYEELYKSLITKISTFVEGYPLKKDLDKVFEMFGATPKWLFFEKKGELAKSVEKRYKKSNSFSRKKLKQKLKNLRRSFENRLPILLNQVIFYFDGIKSDSSKGSDDDAFNWDTNKNPPFIFRKKSERSGKEH